MAAISGKMTLSLRRRDPSRRSSRTSDHTVVEADVPLLEPPEGKSRRKSRRSSFLVSRAQDQSCAGVDTTGAKLPSPETAALAGCVPASLTQGLQDDHIIRLESPAPSLGEQQIDDILRPSGGILSRSESRRSDRLSITSLSGTYEVSSEGDILSSDGSTNLRSSQTGSFSLDEFIAHIESQERANGAVWEPELASDAALEPSESAPTETLDRLLGEVSQQEEDRLRGQDDHDPLPSASADELALNDLLERVNLAEAEPAPKPPPLEASKAAPAAPFQEAELDFDRLTRPTVEPASPVRRQWSQDAAPRVVARPHVLLRGVVPLAIAALVALGVALFATAGGFATIASSWAAFTSTAGGAGSPGAMLQKVISTAPVVCSVALQLSGLGTARRIRRERSTGLLDPLPFVTMVSNCLVWSAYALLNANVTCFVPNFTGYLFGMYYVTNFARHTQRAMKGYYVGLGVVIAALCIAVLTFGMNAAYPIGLFGACSCVSMLASPLATIRTVIRTRSTASLAFPRTLASFIFALSWFTYGLVVAKDHFIYVPNALGLLATVVQLCMFAVFGFAGAPGRAPAAAPMMRGSLKLA